jgi:hypothetical protein
MTSRWFSGAGVTWRTDRSSPAEDVGDVAQVGNWLGPNVHPQRWGVGSPAATR